MNVARPKAISTCSRSPVSEPDSFTYGRAFTPGKTRYEDFEAFLAFLRSLCVDVRLIFNRRRSAEPAANAKVRAGLPNLSKDSGQGR